MYLDNIRIRNKISYSVSGMKVKSYLYPFLCIVQNKTAYKISSQTITQDTYKQAKLRQVVIILYFVCSFLSHHLSYFVSIIYIFFVIFCLLLFLHLFFFSCSMHIINMWRSKLIMLVLSHILYDILLRLRFYNRTYI